MTGGPWCRRSTGEPVASERWSFDPTTRRYRSAETGRFLSEATIARLRDEFLATQLHWAADLTAIMATGRWGVGRWETEMRERITRAYTGAYLLGHGGAGTMTAEARAAIGALILPQFGYLRAFAEAIKRGELTERAIVARAELYLKGARQAFSHGLADGWGLRLPAHPADGSAPCGGNDRCRWRIVEKADRWEATWVMNAAAEHCETCRTRSTTWAPYVVMKEAA